MFTKTKLALIAALAVGTAATALATEFDPNLQNRYPQASPLITGRNVGVIRAPARVAPATAEKAWLDRASRVIDSGTNR